MKKIKRIIFLLGILFTNHTLRASTLLHEASFQQNAEAVRFLAKAHPEWINQIDEDGNTPLHLACKSILNKKMDKEGPDYNLATIIFLTQNGAHIASQNKKGETPLHIAAKKEFLYPVCLLMLMRAEKQVKELEEKNFVAKLINTEDQGGNSALHYAHEASNEQVERLLKEYRETSILLTVDSLMRESLRSSRKSLDQGLSN